MEWAYSRHHVFTFSRLENWVNVLRLSPPATDTQRGLRSERGTPRSAPMHYLRTHAGQGMADRQGRGQTGGRGNPRLGLLRQDSRRGRNLFGKGGRLTRSATETKTKADIV